MEIILPRGLRNHNPLNIRKTGDCWQGIAKVQSDKAFVVFETNQYGYRAAFRLFKTYKNKYGCNTLRKIITKWAPPAENDTEKYIKEVSRMSGIGPELLVDLRNEEQMVAIVTAMAIVENGIKYLDFIKENEVREGYHLAFG